MKKSQIQMGESMGIMFVFLIILIIGVVFFFNVIQSSARVEGDENMQLKAIGIAQKASFLPELQCSEENVRVDNCVDIGKALAFSDIKWQQSTNNLYYFDTFEYSTIYIDQSWPPPAEEDETPCDLVSTGVDEWPICIYDKKPTTFQSRIQTFIPITLFDAKDRDYNFGLMVVQVYR